MMNFKKKYLCSNLAIFTLFSILLVALAGCGTKTERITITGSSTVAPLMAEIARRYESKHPEVRIEVQTGGSTRGIMDTISKRVPIGMASRALKAKEASQAQPFTIAQDGIACIVHAQNPVRNLRREDVLQIFSSNITSWSSFGGPAHDIVVITKAEGHSTLALFCKAFGLKPQDIKAKVVIGDNAQGIKTVMANPNAIGYVSIGAAQTDINHGAAIQLVGLDGIQASTKNVINGTWPISRPLNLIIAHDANLTSHEKSLLALAQSPDIDDLILDLAFVPPSR